MTDGPGVPKMKRQPSAPASPLVVKKARKTRSGKTFFDVLPFELFVRLLQIILTQDMFGYYWPDEFLSLGRVSERNRAAVIEAMNFEIDIYSCGNHFVSKYGLFDTFVKFFGKDLREIQLVYPLTVCHGKTPTLQFLTEPITSLRKATIAGKETHLGVINGNKSLTHLDISLCHSFRMTWKSLINTLKSLALTSLTLHISYKLRPPSIKTLARLADSCKEVRELTFGFIRDGDYTRYWGLITSLPHLEKLSINGKEFPSIFMNKLSHIRELRVSGLLPFDKILPHQSNIVHLRPVQICSGNDIAQLRGFMNLRTLAIEMEEGAEVEVPTTVYNLVGMHLRWISNNTPPEQFTIDDDGYYRADAQAVISAVRNATQLRELALFSVCLPTQAIVEVIKIMGKNLRVLRTHLDFQKTHPGERLEAILLAFAEHCPRVEKLQFLPPCRCLPATAKEKSRWLTAVRVARDNCPELDLSVVSLYISAMRKRR